MLHMPIAQVPLNATGSPKRALFMQVDLKEVFLKILEKCGLCRSHGGSALVLTGRDKEEHVPTEDPAIMPIPELAKMYTVSSSSQEPSDIAVRGCPTAEAGSSTGFVLPEGKYEACTCSFTCVFGWQCCLMRLEVLTCSP